MNDEQPVELRGECPVCERTDVPLRPYRDWYGNERFACADEHACCAAYAHRSAGRRQGRRP